MKTEKTREGIRVRDISSLSLPQTLDCGQCFRWKTDSEGNWCGVVKGVYRKIRQEEDGITILGADETEFSEIWLDYFDFTFDCYILFRIILQNNCNKENEILTFRARDMKGGETVPKR